VLRGLYQRIRILILGFKMTNTSSEEERYDFIVEGAGAAGSVLATELSASGAQVHVVESGGHDVVPTIAAPAQRAGRSGI
jgi:hypothetical protein